MHYAFKVSNKPLKAYRISCVLTLIHVQRNALLKSHRPTVTTHYLSSAFNLTNISLKVLTENLKAVRDLTEVFLRL